MYFGLTNSPATFQMMMNEIFQDLITEGVVSVVVNGVLLPSIALNCLPGCCTKMFNCSGILD
jgi:hypothetical protein